VRIVADFLTRNSPSGVVWVIEEKGRGTGAGVSIDNVHLIADYMHYPIAENATKMY